MSKYVTIIIHADSQLQCRKKDSDGATQTQEEVALHTARTDTTMAPIPDNFPPGNIKSTFNNDYRGTSSPCILHLVVVEPALANKLKQFADIRERCRKRQATQAEHMLSNSGKKRVPIAAGSTVRVFVPQVDRAKSDHRNVIAVVIEEKQPQKYVLGTRFGILEGLYSTNQFDLSETHFILIDEVQRDKKITLREAAGLTSVGGFSQGFIKCSCRKICGPKCKCVAVKMVCNSKCHSKRACNNYCQ